jgi:hypothetical protein
MGFLDFLNKGVKTVKEIQKIADAPSIHTSVYCGKEQGTQAAGIMVENTGKYPANALSAKMAIMQGDAYPFGPDPIPLKWDGKASIDLAGQDKDYLELCVKKGAKLQIPANNETLGAGKYLFEVDIFGSTLKRRKSGLKSRLRAGN